MSEQDTLSILAEEVAASFEPLATAISSPETFNAFMLELGWDLTQIPQPIQNLTTPLQTIIDIIEADEVDISNAVALIDSIKSLITAIKQIQNESDELFPSSLDVNQFKNEFPKQLIEFLAVEYLLDKHPSWGALLKFLGIIRIDPVEAAGNRPAYARKTIAWQELGQTLNNPFFIIASTYKWGSSDFRAEVLVKNLADLASSWGVDFRLKRPQVQLETFLTSNGTQLEPIHNWILLIPILEDSALGVGLEFGIGLFMLPETTTTKPGFSILPYGKGEFDEEIELSDDLVLKIESRIDLAAGVGILMRPEKGVEVFSDIIPSVDSGVSPPTSGFLTIGIQNRGAADSKLILVGSESSSRFEVGVVSLKGGVYTDSTNETDIYAEFELKDAAIIIRPGADDADSFLSSLLPKDGFSINLSLLIGFSKLQGFYFGGSGALEITIPIHKALGPITIGSAYLSVRVDGSEIPIVLAASFNGKLGPVSASVERIGIKFPFSFPEGGDGNLGPIDVGSPAFVPPLGAGLAIDAGPVTGGGYVEFDHENERYAGILQLAFGDIGLIAIGLITTRMPDGSKDFSMLVIIGVEFEPPIPLPYNFNLSGVGGLLGIKRSMNVDYLREGLRQGTLDSVLFPQDPILNAPRIISDLRAGFPPTKDRYIVGPMAIIGWGNPLIIRAEIGIFIEIPSPVRIAILGQITAQLPNAEEDTETIVVIHLDILGVLDFEKQSFSLDATIYDSRILQFALSGDMAMRLYWGDPPFFLTSFGGFNPKFKVRPGTPVLRRMMLSIGKGDNPRLSLECYMALTSNTTQFGAKLELTARKAGFKVHGYLYFHALFIFSPFSFVIDMGAGVEVYKGSRCLLCISLDFTLSGPTPWRAKGTGKFKILFVKVKVRFDKSWGKRQSPSLPATDPWWLLKEALEARGNWKGLLSGEKEQVIRLKKIEDTEVTVAVHPKGRLEISQNVLPFNLILQKFGNGPISGDDDYRITELQINEESVDIGKLNYVKDYFAKAQFIKMSDAEKLSRPSFEKEDANILIGSDDISMGSAVKYDLEYETEIIDENRVTYPYETKTTPMLWKFGGVLLHGRAKRESSPAAKKFRRSDLEPLVGLAEEQYRVVTKDSLNSVTEAAASYSQAQYLMQGFLESHPEQDGNIQIISE